ncbi:MAG: TlpA family protein disulfide reductase [Syntrophorhabdaceae bacterium]|nr:TlpA family protein disulfide reductase [Syntrophorhabdaceae bacterium]
MDLSMKHKKGSGTFLLLLILLIAFAVAAFIYMSWYSGKTGRTSKARLSGSQGSMYAPPFTLKNILGEEFQSTQLARKPVVLNFFTTWCPSCREEIPGFVEVYAKYKESGLEVIGIALDANKDPLPNFIASYGINYRILIGNMETVRAFGGFRSVPMTFFIGKDGKIKDIIAGYIDKAAFEAQVQELIR